MSENELHREKKKNFKSMDTKKNEINEALLNDLLFDKISRKISDTKEISRNLDLKKYPIINDTISNFKSLQNLFKSRSPINYKLLVARLGINTKKIEKLFDFTKEIEKINEENKELQNNEPVFLSKFKELQEEIEIKKKIEEKLRIIIGNNQKKLLSEKNYVFKNRVFLYKTYFFSSSNCKINW